jgi:YHS domain-containing protein
MSTSKRDFLVFGLAGLAWCLAAIKPTLAGDSTVNMDASHIAIQGYDSVSYFTPGTPTKGQPDYAYEWQGAKWLFSSAEHKEQFSKNPDRYAPRFGGFCAWAVEHGVKAKADPNNWIIVDGRLYLSASPLSEADREEALTGKFTKAYANWPKLTQ